MAAIAQATANANLTPEPAKEKPAVATELLKEFYPASWRQRLYNYELQAISANAVNAKRSSKKKGCQYTRHTRQRASALIASAPWIVIALISSWFAQVGLTHDNLRIRVLTELQRLVIISGEILVSNLSPNINFRAGVNVGGIGTGILSRGEFVIDWLLPVQRLRQLVGVNDMEVASAENAGWGLCSKGNFGCRHAIVGLPLPSVMHPYPSKYFAESLLVINTNCTELDIWDSVCGLRYQLRSLLSFSQKVIGSYVGQEDHHSEDGYDFVGPGWSHGVLLAFIGAAGCFWAFWLGVFRGHKLKGILVLTIATYLWWKALSTLFP